MWIIDPGKKVNAIQCSNYECMCKFAILDTEIKHYNNYDFVRCPVCKKVVKLIEDKSE